jgi:hypothetical protein
MERGQYRTKVLAHARLLDSERAANPLDGRGVHRWGNFEKSAPQSFAKTKNFAVKVIRERHLLSRSRPFCPAARWGWGRLHLGQDRARIVPAAGPARRRGWWCRFPSASQARQRRAISAESQAISTLVGELPSVYVSAAWSRTGTGCDDRRTPRPTARIAAPRRNSWPHSRLQNTYVAASPGKLNDRSFLDRPAPGRGPR